MNVYEVLRIIHIQSGRFDENFSSYIIIFCKLDG